ncbi:LAMI_0F02564g1_1 [Lachancea mirantina]|uniref:LAMI_0F02564g1_1 n=1 Tax=Lachancea mirantina TaxID=1230905 RepID=A0A1G4JWM0_9SACH|nr:LAMI_0F02564g1_1 [Lachancea mirantina]
MTEGKLGERARKSVHRWLDRIWPGILNDENPSSFRTITERRPDELVNSFVNMYDKVVTAHDEKALFIKYIPRYKHYRAPKNPIVLCHGLSGFDKLILVPSVAQLVKVLNIHNVLNNEESYMNEDADLVTTKGMIEIEYWIGVKDALEKNGCKVITAKVPGFGSIETRAGILDACIERETDKLRQNFKPEEIYNRSKVKCKESENEPIKVNLIAHSMGGLDCRYLISNIPNTNYKVVSLTTVCTPHRGSEMGDFVVNLADSLEKSLPVENSLRKLAPAIYQLTTSYMEDFNAKTPNDPSIAYFSYGACFHPKWFNVFYPSWRIISDLSNGQPNDGLVTVQSSKWGEYLGTLTNTDHLDIINWKNKLQLELSSKIPESYGFLKDQVRPSIDILSFYMGVANGLAERGF